MPITGGTSVNPLARLQNEDAGYVLSPAHVRGRISKVFFFSLADLVSVHLGGNWSIKCLYGIAAKRASWFFNSR